MHTHDLYIWCDENHENFDEINKGDEYSSRKKGKGVMSSDQTTQKVWYPVFLQP